MVDSKTVAKSILLLAFTISLGAPITWNFISLGYRRVRDIVGLGETKVSSSAAITLCLAIMIQNFASAGTVISAAFRTGDLLLLMSAIPAVSVLIVGLGGIIVIDLRLRYIVGTSAVLASSRLQKLVESIADDLGLSHVPTLRIVSDNRTPFCYGRSSRHATIVLPRNFENICLDASRGDEKTAHSLIKFVIGHELSHIRNGDCVVMTWLTLFYKDMKIILIFASIFIAFSGIFFWQQPVIRIVLASLLLTFISLPILKWTIASISRNREFAADTRSSLLFTTAALYKLAERTEQNVASPIEYLTAFFSMFVTKSNRYTKLLNYKKLAISSIAKLGWSEPKTYTHGNNGLSRMWKVAFSFHPPMDERRESLYKVDHAEKSEPYPSRLSSLQIHVVSTLLFLSLFILLYTIAILMLKSRLTLSDTRALDVVPIVVGGLNGYSSSHS
ncbi:MAG: M48 family metalloprotease, partial [Planctomycetes bacterium]|nr:M48 family metalloprotease [Planctomycetota bacterium]